MKKSQYKVDRPLFYRQPIIIVDGYPRSGKSMMGPIMAGFSGVELERCEVILENISRLYYLKEINKDGAMYLLRLEPEMRLYESLLSRNINFRIKDHSGVFKQINPMRYVKRLFAKEGDSVVKYIKKYEPIYQNHGHDVLRNVEIYFDAMGDNLRLIEMQRHPVDVVYSQYSRGYCTREGFDPRSWDITITHKDNILPWYTYGWEEEYLQCASPIDKIIKIHLHSVKLTNESYNKLSSKQKKQIIFISFDSFVANPGPYIKKLESFIGRKTNKYIRKTLKQQKCPRPIRSVLKQREKRLKEIKTVASPECYKILISLCKNFDNDVKTKQQALGVIN
jgi:hypothetical protein